MSEEKNYKDITECEKNNTTDDVDTTVSNFDNSASVSGCGYSANNSEENNPPVIIGGWDFSEESDTTVTLYDWDTPVINWETNHATLLESLKGWEENEEDLEENEENKYSKIERRIN